MLQTLRSRFVERRVTIALAAGVSAMILVGTGTPSFADPITPEGIWYTKGNESIIKVMPCNTAFCGTIVWLKDPNEADGSQKIDKLNKDPLKKDRPILGADILIDMVATNDHWKGKAYNPDDGKFYDITFIVKTDKEPNDKADLRGCILGFLCQTETFTRAAEVPGGGPTVTAATPGAAPTTKTTRAHGAKKDKDTAHK